MQMCDMDMYGDGYPVRPVRDVASSSANPTIRLMNGGDLRALNGRTGGVALMCTPLVEEVRDGSRLGARPYAGLTISTAERRRHVLVIGATGAGKSYVVAIPAIAATLRDTRDSLVISNLKGPAATEEIAAAARAIDPECEVIVFAIGDPTRSVGCNLLKVARKQKQLSQLVRYLSGVIARGQNDGAFWEVVSKRMMHAALAYGEVDSLAALNELFCDGTLFSAFAKAKGDPAMLDFERYRESGSNGSTSAQDLGSRLSAFTEDAEMRAVTSGADELDPGDLLASGRRFCLIIEVNENKFDTSLHAMGLFFTLFFGSAVRVAEKAGGVLPRPVSFFLDEFGLMPALPEFHKIANMGRSRGFSIWSFVQSVEQVYATYGQHAGAVMAAYCSKVILCSGLGTVDCEFGSRLRGNTMVQEWRETQQLDPTTGLWLPMTRSSFSQQRPLVTPEDMRLSPHPVFGGYAYVFLVDQPPVIVHFTPSFEVGVLERAMAEGRSAPRARRGEPLPAVAATGLIRVAGRDPGGAISRAFTEATGLSDEEVSARIQQTLEKLDWGNTTGSARAWFQALLDENKGRGVTVLRLAEELAARKVTVTEFYLAGVHSATDSVTATLHYLDYTREKRAADKVKTRSKRDTTGGCNN